MTILLSVLARCRPLLIQLGTLVVIAVMAWLLLKLPDDDWYVENASIFNSAVEPLVWVGAIAQTAFVALWMTSPWWRRAITRSLMITSLGLALLLDLSLANAHVPTYAEATAVALVVIGLVVIGSVSQLLALMWEMWKRRRVGISRRYDERHPGVHRYSDHEGIG